MVHRLDELLPLASLASSIVVQRIAQQLIAIWEYPIGQIKRGLVLLLHRYIFRSRNQAKTLVSRSDTPVNDVTVRLQSFKSCDLEA